MKISISIEAMLGLNWRLWQELIPRIEEMGFHTLFRSDHFMIGNTGADSLEPITSLTYLAQHSRRLRFGTLVSPLSMHHPAMLARQAMAIGELSGGRMILGLGAGWHQEEHDMFGFRLGSVRERMDRFEEGVKVIHALMHDPEPVTFPGRYFQLRAAQLLPRAPVPLLIGGNGPTRTLPLVARYADIWNCQLASPDEFRQINARLDDLIAAAGRAPADVRRTVMVPVICARTEHELSRHISLLRQHTPVFRDASQQEIQSALFDRNGIVGPPAEVIDRLSAYAEYGVEEVILEWFGLYDLDGLELLGAEVVPAFGEVGREQ